MRTLFFLGVMLLGASSLLADELVLKNGSVLHGRIVREERDQVTIDLGRGRMSIARRDIVAIKRGSPTPAGDPSTESDAPPVDAPSPAQKRTRPAPRTSPQKATDKDPTAEKQPAAQPTRKRKPGGPKIVQVERVPAKPSKGAGPESSAPSRKSASRGTPPPDPTPDW
jgi:hypothetical protein